MGSQTFPIPTTGSGVSYSTYLPPTASKVLVDGQLISSSFSTTVTGNGGIAYLYTNYNSSSVQIGSNTYSASPGNPIITSTFSGSTSFTINALLPSGVNPTASNFTAQTFPFGVSNGYGNQPASNGSGTWVYLPQVRASATTSGYISTNNGTTWTTMTMPSSAYYSSLAYGNGKWVALNGSNTIFYSTNGTTWSTTTFSNGRSYAYVAFGVASGNGTGYFVTSNNQGSTPYTMPYSTDGVTWNFGVQVGSNFSWSACAYSNGCWVVGDGSPTSYYTTNPSSSWSSFSLYTTPNPPNFAYGNGKWVTLNNGSSNGQYVNGSVPNGTWAAMSVAAAYAWYNVIFGNGYFIGLANGAGNSTSAYMYSPNGTTWTLVTLPGTLGYNTSGNGAYANNTYMIGMTSGMYAFTQSPQYPVTYGLYGFSDAIH